jgi:hypothetical protein
LDMISRPNSCRRLMGTLRNRFHPRQRFHQMIRPIGLGPPKARRGAEDRGALPA